MASVVFLAVQTMLLDDLGSSMASAVEWQDSQRMAAPG